MTDSNQSLRELFKAQSTQLQKSLESYEKAFKEKNGEGRNWQRDTPTAEVDAASRLEPQEYDPKTVPGRDPFGVDVTELYYSLKTLSGMEFAWHSDAEIPAKVANFCQQLEVVRPVLGENSAEFSTCANRDETVRVGVDPEEMTDLTMAPTEMGSGTGTSGASDGTIPPPSSFVSERFTGGSGL